MTKSNNQKRILSLLMLSATAVVWGVGFVFTDQLLLLGFAKTPGLQNAFRFVIGTVFLVILLWKDIKLSKKNILYGLFGGAMLFAGFMLQLVGQTYITPAHCGFFTALYFVMTPFITWIFYKKKPNFAVIIAVVCAVLGLAILNIGHMPTKEETLGMILTIIGALMFAIQIVFCDYLLANDKIKSNNLVVLQLVVASLLFVLYTLIFESKNYATLSIQWDLAWWRLAIVALIGTGFAYFAQMYAQNHVSPAQTSLILACETPIGAIVSIMVGIDQFSWNIVIGGLLIIGSIFIIEFLPQSPKKPKELQAKHTDTPTDSN